MEDRWAKLEEIVRRVVREEVSTALKKPAKSKVKFENGKFVGLGLMEIAALEAAYPAVDVQRELKEAAAWILLNPNEAPVSDFGKFLNTWLKKHQDRAAIRAIPTRNDVAPGPGRKLCAYCDAVATANFGGTWACRTHGQDAMDGKPVPMMKIPVMAKPVAGRD